MGVPYSSELWGLALQCDWKESSEFLEILRNDGVFPLTYLYMGRQLGGRKCFILLLMV